MANGLLSNLGLDTSIGGTSKVIMLQTPTAILVIFLMSLSVQCSWFPSFRSNSKLGVFDKAAVATDAAPCAPIGRQIMAKNGSVVDVAIAVLSCMGVVHPQSQGLGGGFLMVVYNRKENVATFIDAREVAPLKASRDMFGGNETLARKGELSIAVPAELAGFSAAYEKFGSLPWEELFAPTIELCRKGFPVTRNLADALSTHRSLIMGNPNFRNIFVNKTTGDLYKEGEQLFRPDLAETFQIISRDGKKALYGEGQLAKNFLQDIQGCGSIITKEDILKYRPKFKKPVQVNLTDDLKLYSASVPGSGALEAFALSVLKLYNITENVKRKKKCTVLTLHRIIEVLKFTFSKRMEMSGDDLQMEELLNNLTSQDYANSIHSKISDERTFDPSYYYDPSDVFQEDHGTAHMSVVTENGDAVSVTSTINGFFGCECMSRTTGIILNDQMDDFSSPNITNYFDVPPSPHNYIVPGRSPVSSMSPSIFVDGKGDIRLVIGASGGTMIISSVLMCCIRNLFLGEDIKTAIDGPRFHHQLLPNKIEYYGNFSQDIINELRKMGHQIEKSNKGMVGIVIGIERSTDGKLRANADYRKAGAVDGY